jgi:DNA-binding NtrC family response regulator
MNTSLKVNNRTAALHVLVVDDEPLACWSIAETLTEHGDVVTEVKSGAAALVVMAGPSEPVDVILLDYRLPDSRDLGLLAALRRMAPGCPIILMTAHGTPEIAREALALGAYRVVAKPFELPDIAALVHEAHERP